VLIEGACRVDVVCTETVTMVTGATGGGAAAVGLGEDVGVVGLGGGIGVEDIEVIIVDAVGGGETCEIEVTRVDAPLETMKEQTLFSQQVHDASDTPPMSFPFASTLLAQQVCPEGQDWHTPAGSWQKTPLVLSQQAKLVAMQMLPQHCSAATTL
jgi:hypothetical protein